MALRLLALLGLSLVAGQAQQPATRFLHVAVTDPMNRFVTGLERNHFSVREGDAQRPVSFLATPDTSIALAVVADGDVRIGTADRGPIRVFVARSVAEALRLVTSDPSTRKALVITTDDPQDGVPANVFVQRVNRHLAEKAVIEAINRYVVGFASANTVSTATIELNQPTTLPTLKASY